VNDRTGEGANTLFTITEAAGDDRGLYITSPSLDAKLTVAVKEPDDNLRRLYQSKEMHALLASKDENSKFGVWILIPVLGSPALRY